MEGFNSNARKDFYVASQIAVGKAILKTQTDVALQRRVCASSKTHTENPNGGFVLQPSGCSAQPWVTHAPKPI